MSDIGKGIGDAMVFFAVLAALGAPTAIGGIIGLAFAAAGLVQTGIVIGCFSLIVGVICACIVARAA